LSLTVLKTLIKMKDNKYTIVVCCQEGHGTLEALKAFWEKENMSGCTTWVDYNGNRHRLRPYGKLVGNDSILVIGYRGGVLQDNKTVASDTRTQAQKNALFLELFEIKSWFEKNKSDFQKIAIVNKCDLVTDAFPFRIKENPSFDAVEEYGFLFD
jgi:ketopantoate reductase